MKFIRGLINLKPEHGPSAVTIGNFDGVHRGHQHLLRRFVATAAERGLPAVVILLEPQPNEFFPNRPTVARLTRLREKLPLLAECGVNYVLAIHFNQDFSKISAQAFVEQVLLQQLQARYVLLGDDFHFGYRRQGNFALVAQLGQKHGFEVDNINTVQHQGERVSSTAVRQALAAGELSLAEQLLGRPYGMYGRVAHGDKRGRIIGFPTANIYLHRKLTPITGVYCVKVYGLKDELIYGVANVGNRPTVDGTRTLLEVHLFNFDEEIYGHYLRVDFMHKLREEKRYNSFELLKQQILLDAENAKNYFGIKDHE